MSKASKFLKTRIFKNAAFLLTGVGVVLVWRGVWGFMDLFLFPGAKVISFSVSIVLGVLILLLDDGFLEELKH